MIYCMQPIGKDEKFYFIVQSERQLENLRKAGELIFMTSGETWIKPIASTFYIQRNAVRVSAKEVPEKIKKLLREELARTKNS